MLLNFTDAIPVKSVPVIVTDVPDPPDAGEILLIAGIGVTITEIAFDVVVHPLIVVIVQV